MLKAAKSSLISVELIRQKHEKLSGCLNGFAENRPMMLNIDQSNLKAIYFYLKKLLTFKKLCNDSTSNNKMALSQLYVRTTQLLN